MAAAILGLVPIFRESVGEVISSGAHVVTGYGEGVKNVMTSYGKGTEAIMGAVADRIRGRTGPR